MKRYLQGPAALFVTLLIVLALGEVALRIFSPVSFRNPRSDVTAEGWKGAIHQASPIPGLIYELAPNRRVKLDSTSHTTNSHGMRNREVVPDRERPVRRLAILGDSVTYGYGVGDDESFPSVLEQLLNASVRESETGFEVLNFGVGGYSTRDEALLLKHKVLAFNPGLILICYDLNDPEIEPVQPLSNHFRQPLWWERSHLLRLLAKAKRDWDLNRIGGGDYFRYLHGHTEKWESVERAFDDIAATAAGMDIPVMFTIWTWTREETWEDYPYADLLEQVERAAGERGFHVIDLFSRLSEFEPRSLTVSDWDMHPSALGHQVIAGSIAGALGFNAAPLPR